MGEKKSNPDRQEPDFISDTDLLLSEDFHPFFQKSRSHILYCDSRFRPVESSELDDIHVEVTVLGPMKPVGGPRDILIGWHGMVLQKEGRSALFLPQVALEFGWELEETLERLSRKAGLEPDDWRSGARFKVFGARIYSEDVY